MITPKPMVCKTHGPMDMNLTVDSEARTLTPSCPVCDKMLEEYESVLDKHPRAVPFKVEDYLITEQDIAEYRKAMDEQEVPQEGRMFEILGVVYGPDDQIPEHVKEIIRRLCS